MFKLLTGNLFFASALIVSLVAYARSRPPRSHLSMTFAGALAASILLAGTAAWYVRIMLVLDYWSLCAILLVIAAPYLRIHYGQHRELLVRMLLPPAAAAFTVLCLLLSAQLRPVTLDHYLYAFDGSLGFQPGFWGAQVLLGHPWLLTACEVAYLNLPLGLGLVYFGLADSSQPLARKTLALYFTIAAFGYICYYLFPGAGSAVVFGDAFPFHPPALRDIRIEPIVVRFAPRNCMPSLHASWALAMWWSSRSLPQLGRWASWSFGALTLAYALSQHYLIDLVVAVPFTLACYAVTRGSAALRIRECRITMGAAAALFVTWLLALRWEIRVFVDAPIRAWCCVAFTLLVCLLLKVKMERSLALVCPVAEANLPRPYGERKCAATLADAGSELGAPGQG